jgi:hypothetical protein
MSRSYTLSSPFASVGVVWDSFCFYSNYSDNIPRVRRGTSLRTTGLGRVTEGLLMVLQNHGSACEGEEIWRERREYKMTIVVNAPGFELWPCE